MSPPAKKHLEQLRDQIQLKHFSFRAEEAYAYWTREYILFHKAKTGAFRHPGELGVSEVNQFLTNLAITEKVPASTQNQALCALLFLYRELLNVEIPNTPLNIVRARKPERLPIVLTCAEIHLIGRVSLYRIGVLFRCLA